MNSRRERGLGTATALVGTVAAYLHWTWHPFPVLRGMVPTDVMASPVYMACVFPLFGWLGASWVFAALRRERGLVSGAGLLLVPSALSVVRLLGGLPLSGHALFLGAALGFEPGLGGDDAPVRRALLGLGLAVTLFFKVEWSDVPNALASLGVGAALGLLLRALRGWERR